MKIACLGSSSGKPGESMYDAMYEVGKLLAEQGHTVITGGHGGSGMEAPAKGAFEAGGEVILYPLSMFPKNEYGTKVVDCSADGKNSPEMELCVRLDYMMEADGFIVGVDGGNGTALEMLALINLQTKVWKKNKEIIALYLYDVRSTVDDILIGVDWPNECSGGAVNPHDAVTYVTR